MILSQFSVVLANFRRKMEVFSKTNIMTKIFGDFSQFSAGKSEVFLKKML
jgi:hypothetical protein